jgi:hypothetical protein
VGRNSTSAATFHDKEAATLAARWQRTRFSTRGRLHHYERLCRAPNGNLESGASIGSSRVKVPREFDPAAARPLQFLHQRTDQARHLHQPQLARARKSVEGEGVTAASQLPEKDKGVFYFDPKLIQLQKDFCRDILTQVNPYTQRA